VTAEPEFAHPYCLQILAGGRGRIQRKPVPQRNPCSTCGTGDRRQCSNSFITLVRNRKRGHLSTHNACEYCLVLALGSKLHASAMHLGRIDRPSRIHIIAEFAAMVRFACTKQTVRALIVAQPNLQTREIPKHVHYLRK
jgi:hypothetical protein